MRKEGNLIFLDKPTVYSMVDWGMQHLGCCSLILNKPELSSTTNVVIVAYVENKLYNHDVYEVAKNSNGVYKVLTPYGGGGLWEKR